MASLEPFGFSTIMGSSADDCFFLSDDGIDQSLTPAVLISPACVPFLVFFGVLSAAFPGCFFPPFLVSLVALVSLASSISLVSEVPFAFWDNFSVDTVTAFFFCSFSFLTFASRAFASSNAWVSAMNALTLSQLAFDGIFQARNCSEPLTSDFFLAPDRSWSTSTRTPSAPSVYCAFGGRIRPSRPKGKSATFKRTSPKKSFEPTRS